MAQLLANSTASLGAKAPSLPHNRLALLSNVSPRLFHTGGVAPAAAADFNNSTPVITELYVAEIFVPTSCVVQGINVFNGSDVTDSTKLGLYDVGGTLIAATASTAGSGTDAYQKIPFASEFISTGAKVAISTPIQLAGGTYYIGQIFNGTTTRYNTHVLGSFGAGKITGLVYATALDTLALSIAPPTTFTTALGPVAALY